MIFVEQFNLWYTDIYYRLSPLWLCGNSTHANGHVMYGS